jgi:hypothetical protein
VVCFDEIGPIGLIPYHGSGWAPVKRPERLRATYSKRNGVLRIAIGHWSLHRCAVTTYIYCGSHAGRSSTGGSLATRAKVSLLDDLGTRLEIRPTQDFAHHDSRA